MTDDYAGLRAAIEAAINCMENDAEKIDGEWGTGRGKERLRADGDLPPEIAALEACEPIIARLLAERDALLEDAERWRKWLPWLLTVNRKPFNLAMELDAIRAAMKDKP